MLNVVLNVQNLNQENQNKNPNPVIEFELVEDKSDWFDTVVLPPHILSAIAAYEDFTGLDDWRSLDFENKLYWFCLANPLIK